jgi:hypothetical protein
MKNPLNTKIMKNLFAKNEETKFFGIRPANEIQSKIDFIEEKGYKINVVGKLTRNTDLYYIANLSSVEYLNSIEILNTWNDGAILNVLSAYCSAIQRMETQKQINPIFNELKIK